MLADLHLRRMTVGASRCGALRTRTDENINARSPTLTLRRHRVNTWSLEQEMAHSRIAKCKCTSAWPGHGSARESAIGSGLRPGQPALLSNKARKKAQPRRARMRRDWRRWWACNVDWTTVECCLAETPALLRRLPKPDPLGAREIEYLT
jgi:hypothetical protein